MPFTKSNLNIEEDVGTLKKKEIHVYPRRPNSRYKENLTLETLMKSDPIIAPSTLESLPNTGNHEPNDLHIAIRKQRQSYTLHPISKFVSYNTLSLKFHTFTFNLDRIKISKNIKEA